MSKNNRRKFGLQTTGIDSLVLKYVISRVGKGRLCQEYIYFGTVANPELGISGGRHWKWVPFNRLFDIEMVEYQRVILRHYFTSGSTHKTMIGTMYGTEDKPTFALLLASPQLKNYEDLGTLWITAI